MGLTKTLLLHQNNKECSEWLRVMLNFMFFVHGCNGNSYDDDNKNNIIDDHYYFFNNNNNFMIIKKTMMRLNNFDLICDLLSSTNFFFFAYFSLSNIWSSMIIK